MDIIKRMKNDSKFRIRAVIIFVLFMLVYPSLIGDKKEFTRQSFETCHAYNSIDWFTADRFIPWDWHTYKSNTKAVDSNDKSECRDAGCFVATIPIDFWADKDVCVPSVLNGWLAETSTDTAESCESGCTGSVVGTTKIYCKACAEGETPQVCNGAEKMLANIIPSSAISSCKTRYYILIFGIGFLALMVFAMM